MMNQSSERYDNGAAYMSGGAAHDRQYRMDRGYANGGNRSDFGVGELFSSMLGFANASTVFTIHQMQNALVVFMEPQSVLNRVKHQLDKISSAMTESVDEARHDPAQRTLDAQQRRSEPVTASTIMDPSGAVITDDDVLTGRKR
jgi:hypothetical protein